MIAALFFVLLPIVVFWLIWAAMFLANDPAEEIWRTKRHQFLGRGGPDDPSANDPFVDF
jgi:hypothetical protein